jgi:hypothetical protein
MDKEKQTKIKELVDIYKNNQEEIAADILNVFKKDSKNYGELRQQVKQLERGLLYTNSDKCTSLIWEINELLEKEMTELLITSSLEK